MCKIKKGNLWFSFHDEAKYFDYIIVTKKKCFQSNWEFTNCFVFKQVLNFKIIIFFRSIFLVIVSLLSLIYLY